MTCGFIVRASSLNFSGSFPLLKQGEQKPTHAPTGIYRPLFQPLEYFADFFQSLEHFGGSFSNRWKPGDGPTLLLCLYLPLRGDRLIAARDVDSTLHGAMELADVEECIGRVHRHDEFDLSNRYAVGAKSIIIRISCTSGCCGLDPEGM